MENEKFEYHTGYLSGKELVKKGTTKDGKKWKLYKIAIKTREEDQFGVKFNVFDSAKGFDKFDELEGECVVIGFKRASYTHSEFGEQESRTVSFIGEGKIDDIKKFEYKFGKGAKPKEEVKVSGSISVNSVPITEKQQKVLDSLKKGNLNGDSIINVEGVKITVKDFLGEYYE